MGKKTYYNVYDRSVPWQLWPVTLSNQDLAKIKDKFASPEHIGPKSVADFDEITDEDARAIRQRDAYERVNALLQRLGGS